MKTKPDYEVAADELRDLYNDRLPQAQVVQVSKHGAAVDDGGWKHTAWVFLIGGVEFKYKTGTAHTKAPRQEEVFANYCREARDSECTFEDWCANYGYDTDSRKALDTYLECQSAKAKVLRVTKSWSLCEQFADLANRL